MTFSRELRAWRKRNKMTNEQAAKHLNTKLRTFEDWQAGRHTPSHLAIEAIRAKLGVRAANKKLKTKIRNHIVAGSDDEGAAWGFDACDAEEIKSPNGRDQ